MTSEKKSFGRKSAWTKQNFNFKKLDFRDSKREWTRVKESGREVLLIPSTEMCGVFDLRGDGAIGKRETWCLFAPEEDKSNAMMYQNKG